MLSAPPGFTQSRLGANRPPPRWATVRQEEGRPPTAPPSAGEKGQSLVRVALDHLLLSQVRPGIPHPAPSKNEHAKQT